MNDNGTTGDETDDYYEIANAGNLFWFASQVNNGNTNYNAKLTNSIDMGYNIVFDPDSGLVAAKKGYTTYYIGTGIKGDNSGDNMFFDEDASENYLPYSKLSAGYRYAGFYPADLYDWAPIGNSTQKYTGTFDGNGKTVSGLFNIIKKNNLGLFGYVGYDGTVQNVTVANSLFYETNCVGGVCGINDGIMKNCSGTSAVIGDTNVGGVCGYYDGTVTNCFTTATVGGVCRAGNGDQYNCYYLASEEDTKGGRTASQFADGSVAYTLNDNGQNQIRYDTLYVCIVRG